MDKPAARVLKADEVKVQGCFHLDVGHSAQRPASAGKTMSSTPQVCIVEKTADFAVIEIACSCGTKTRVRCEYNETKSS